MVESLEMVFHSVFYHDIPDNQAKEQGYEAVLNHARPFNNFLIATTSPDLNPDIVSSNPQFLKFPNF